MTKAPVSFMLLSGSCLRNSFVLTVNYNIAIATSSCIPSYNILSKCFKFYCGVPLQHNYLLGCNYYDTTLPQNAMLSSDSVEYTCIHFEVSTELQQLANVVFTAIWTDYIHI